MITTAYISIWGQRAAAIAWDEATGTGDFEYDRGFLYSGLDLAPAMMPVGQARGKVFSFPGHRASATYRGLPGLLADVLPDRYGNTLINAWLARKGRPADSMNPVEMLCFVGHRGMGAMEFEPVVPKGGDASVALEIDSLVRVAQEILTGREQFSTHLGKGEEKALLDILKIGTSAGGARAKAVIAYNPATREVRSGQGEVPKGFTHWLIKFDGVTDSEMGSTRGYGRVEMAYHLMATDCGIEMMECRLLEEGGRAHFMTRRFDRMPERVHVQTLCALMHYDFADIRSYSYEMLFRSMRMLRLPYPQAEQMYRRMVFNVLARNCDDHTKNFAFMMDRSGEWGLAPAYDVCHAYRPGSIWVSRQSLSVNGKREHIHRTDLLTVAAQMHIKKADAIIDHIQSILCRWPEYAEQTRVAAPLRDAVGSTLILQD